MRAPITLHDLRIFYTDEYGDTYQTWLAGTSRHFTVPESQEEG